jgi:hypothetical protein
MLGLGGISFALAAAVLDRRAATEVFYGMLGPLAAAVGSWMVMERAARKSPERLTAVMLAAFAGKLVLFGAYVVVMLRVLGLRPGIFIASFTSYFIALYAVEAMALRRLSLSR